MTSEPESNITDAVNVLIDHAYSMQFLAEVFQTELISEAIERGQIHDPEFDASSIELDWNESDLYRASLTLLGSGADVWAHVMRKESDETYPRHSLMRHIPADSEVTVVDEVRPSGGRAGTRRYLMVTKR